MRLDLFPVLFSSLFRLCSLIFLRVIPSRLAIFVLPALYLAYSLSLCVCPATSTCSVHNTDPSKSMQKPKPRQPSGLSVLILSFKTHTRLPNLINLTINTLLILASVDLTFNPVFYPAKDVIFTRVGAVYPDAVKIVVRYPPSSNATNQEDIRILYRIISASDSPWQDGPILSLHQSSDWVVTSRVKNLWPNTAYEYRFAGINRTLLPYPSSPIKFQTFPDPRLHTGSRFSFVVSSCITPNFPYSGPTQRQTIRGFDRLATYLQSKLMQAQPDVQGASDVASELDDSTLAVSSTKVSAPPFKFMLFLGDFIYADVPTYFGDNQEAYRRLYRRNYQSPSFRKIYEHLPMFHAYDDHEIMNNFAGDGGDPSPYINASNAFKIYNGDANYDSTIHGEHYYEFSHGDVAFFVMDTRRHRSDIEHTDSAFRTMLGSAQREALFTWLSKVNNTCTFKFIMSSVPLTSLWGQDAVKDSWAGYMNERSLILDAFHSVPNVFVLSGDRHEFAAIEFSAGDPQSHVVRELSTGPLNMFYIPFVRTLRMNSVEVVETVKTEITLSDSGPKVNLHRGVVPRERVLKYHPSGNTKWSTFEIDTTDNEKPILRVETIVDGQPVYHFETIGTPTRYRPAKGLTTISSNIEQILEKFGFQRSKWF